MRQADNRSSRLAALLADVLSEGGPEPELLARYAGDPNSLSPEERRIVERSVSESPEVRDQLELLKRFHVSEASEPSTGESSSGRVGALAWILGLFEPRLRLAWAPAIVVVALAVVMGVAMGRWWESPGAVPQHLTISTGTEGGTYITIGRRLAQLLPASPGSNIGHVEARPSDGTVENCRRLASSEADLALATGPVLALTADPCTGQTRALMALYTNRLHVVTRREASIEQLRDLKGKRIFLGADGSGTKLIATMILAAVELADAAGDFERADPTTLRTFHEASLGLRNNELDAAFFLSSTPVKAVWDALDDPCCTLLDLGAESLEGAVPGLTRQQIPAQSYPNQLHAKTTVGAKALLIGRKDLRDDVVEEILNTLVHHIEDLTLASIHVQDARLETAFDEQSFGGIALHPGVEKFRAEWHSAESRTSRQ